jgi:methylmalonyl-CoA mutase
MFAEGGPERTNKLSLCKCRIARKTLTAWWCDFIRKWSACASRYLWKIGNAGVSICCLDDAKKLYSGFDLVHAMTSVVWRSMDQLQCLGFLWMQSINNVKLYQRNNLRKKLTLK